MVAGDILSEIAAQKIYVPTRTEGSFLEVLGVALRLGLTYFGGPIEHLGYFREDYVMRWTIG